MAGLFSSATLEQIRAASDIVDVIHAVVPLKRAGANFVALCPFHKEKTPSFNVSPHRQSFHCFGCHKGGDVFRFLQEYENLSFPEAVRRLAERARIPLELDPAAGTGLDRFLKDKLLDIHEQCAKRWQGALANEAAGEIARQYLARRGVSDQAVQLFRLGCAPDAWDDTVNWAKTRGYDLAVVEQAGLIVRKPGESRYYDRFRGRLMFPICDEQGRVIAFSGRVLRGDEKTAKYVNSPETPIFTKSKVFYGLDKSKRALLEKQSAVVCEGQLDLIACFISGVQNVVAPQGTAFTSDHARILKRYVNEVVLCFDSDTAGQEAAVRVLDSLLASGLTIRVAVVPAPHDPDSFIKEKGAEVFANLIANAAGFFDYYLDQLCHIHDLRTDKGPLAVTRSMADALHKAASTVLTDKYAQKTALRLGVSPDAVRLEFKRIGGSRAAVSRPESSERIPLPPIRPSAQEFWLLKILLLHEDLAEWLAAHLDLSWIEHASLRGIVAARFAALHDSNWAGPASLFTHCEDETMVALLSEVLAEGRPVPNPRQQLSDIVLRLRNQALDRELASLIVQASRPDLEDGRKVELLHRVQAVRAGKNQPLASRQEPS